MQIYKEYDKDALDRQYNNRLNAPDHEQHLQQWEILSRETEKKYPVTKNIPYGELLDEKLDIFPSQQPHSKILVFIHGGYWHKHTAPDFYLIAEAFRSYELTTVIIDYPLMPEFSMDQLVLSCQRAIGWVYKNISQYNGNPDQIYVSGHSAGGHLASMMMTTDWREFNNKLSADLIKGICAISGLYNLVPIQLCYVNDVLKMDTATSLRNSPVQLRPKTNCPLLLAVGADESAEYLVQSRELFTAWPDQIIKLLEIPGLNHFSILETMLDHSSTLHKAMCRLMNIGNDK